ncbi:MAG: Mannosylfructose-phosphate synthase [candidate division WS2 bacterium ADurb.Bin280]|uniref:Mannosylfructose-phosphate synthase n=1 Tax=candidate division WS2 bacterium ADurb.Bin280 TaxID=1852829 RepID=A0A1V5SC19_9BACT|nr:MAG: Mannosylfructose-phosphate synthase [candidate division WS2 bacterium ADurb.Bin280]
MTGEAKNKNIKNRLGSWLRWLFSSKERRAKSSIKQTKATKTETPIESPPISRKAESKPSTRKTKVLMLGWELPPHNSGGLGVACHDLCESIHQLEKAQITFLLPHDLGIKLPFMKVIACAPLSKRTEKALGQTAYGPRRNSEDQAGDLEGDLVDQVEKYAKDVEKILSKIDFDIIHAHDWLSFKAGIKAKEISGKPLIAHIHSTEFDRSGGGFIYQKIADIEKMGLSNADKIITVSNLTKNQIVDKYSISPSKISVIHNGVSHKWNKVSSDNLKMLKKVGKKIVLFVGRMTIQKGPDYFIKAAKKVSQVMDEAVFVMVGAGDMERQIIEQAASLGLSDKVFFTGFVSIEERNSLYRSADVYVMPSISEPFGIVALESLINRTPIIISKQSGVSETIRHALKVDFWDTDEMAEKIVAVLKHKSLNKTLLKNGESEAKTITWEKAAQKCIDIYESLTK